MKLCRSRQLRVGAGHGLQQGVLVRIMEIEGGPVKGCFIGDLLYRNILEILAGQ